MGVDEMGTGKMTKGKWQMYSLIDLHVHSTASDGRLTPEQVIDLAAARRIKLLALTDHDTTHGCAAAQTRAAHLGLTLIAGVEINTDSDLGEIHLLAYFARVDQPQLQTALADLQQRRRERALEIIAKLNKIGVAVTFEQVQGTNPQTAITRAHIAQALVESQQVADKAAAFELYLGRNKPAFVPRYAFDPKQAIDLIRSCSGVASVAHPVRSGNVGHIPELVRMGLQALEVYYPDHTSSDITMLKELADVHGLVHTGGSDFHAERSESKSGVRGLGSVWVPEAAGEKLLAAIKA